MTAVLVVCLAGLALFVGGLGTAIARGLTLRLWRIAAVGFALEASAAVWTIALTLWKLAGLAA